MERGAGICVVCAINIAPFSDSLLLFVATSSAAVTLRLLLEGQEEAAEGTDLGCIAAKLLAQG